MVSSRNYPLVHTPHLRSAECPDKAWSPSSVIISSHYFPLQVFLLLAVLAPVPGSPLLPGLTDLSRMLEPAASLLQMTGGAISTGVGGVPVTTVPVATVPVVTTVPAPVPPPMMMPTILPVILAVAVIKALVLGKIHFSYTCIVMVICDVFR